MNFLTKMYLKNKAKKVLSLNKPIEIMSDDELKLELFARFEEMKETNTIDDRSNQIIQNILSRKSREKNYVEKNLMDFFIAANSLELRKEFLKRYSRYIDEENLEDFLGKIVRVERKDIPLKEADKRRNEYSEILYSENIDKIDISNIFLYNPQYSFFEKIYEKLDKQRQDALLIELLKNHSRLLSDERVKKLFHTVSNYAIKHEILKGNRFLNKKIKEDLGIDITLTPDDVREFYRNGGKLEYDIAHTLRKERKMYTSEELIDELKYFKDNEEKENFIAAVINQINNDEAEKIVFNENIENNTRLLVLQYYIDRVPFQDRVELFSKLGDEIRKQSAQLFTRFYLGDAENLLNKEEYVDKILAQITDPELYNDFIIESFDPMGIMTEKTFEVLSNNPDYLEKKHLADKMLLKFSDEQIKELYEKGSDLVKSKIVDLSRRKSEYTFLYDKDDTVEKIREYNKTVPKYILINENNYFEMLKDADILTFNRLFRIEEYRNLLTKKQLLQVSNKMINQCDIKDIYSYVSNMFRNADINLDDVKNELLQISNINEKSKQVEYARELIRIYNSKKISENDNSYKSEDVSDLITELIKSQDTTIENKYLYLALMNLSYKERKDDKALYEYICKLAGKNENYPFYSRKEILPFLYDDYIFDVLAKLYDNNHEVIQTISPALLDKNVLSKIDYELMEFYSRYRSDNSIKNVFEDDTKFVLFINIYNRINELKSFPEEDLQKLIYCINAAKSTELEGIESQNDIDKFISKCLSIYGQIGFSREEYDNYEKIIKEESRKIIEQPLSNRSQLFDAIGKRFLNLSYKEMKSLMIKYAEDVNYFIQQYENKEELTLEEQNELCALKTIRNIKEILNIQDKNAIIQTYNELDQDETFESIDFTASIALEENVKRVFTKDYIKDLYIPKEADKKVIDGLNVYSPTDFNMFVTVIGAYSGFKLIDKEHPEKSAVEAWQSKESKSSHLMCTSYIRNTNISYVRPILPEKEIPILGMIKKIFKSKDILDDLILLGFEDIGVNSVQMSSTADIAIRTNVIESQKAYRYFSFRSADNLSNGTRIMYNEVDIERRLEEDKLTNIEPSYVVCFDRITEASKKVAKDFNIPIIYVDNKEIAKRESEKLEKTFEKYEKTQDPSLLKDIIIQYMNNSISFSFTRRDLIKEYFNEETMTKRINEIISKLDKQYKFGDKSKAVQGLQVLKKAFDEEIEKYNYGNLSPELSNCSKFDIKQFSFDLKNHLNSKEMPQKTNSGKEDMDETTNSYHDYMLKKIKHVEGEINDER